MTKDKKSAYQKRHNQKKQNRFPWVLTLVGVAVIIIAAVFIFQKPAASFTPIVTGRPGLQVDKELVDLGDVKLGDWVTVSFKVTNVGDQPLKFTSAPYIEVKEGC